MPGKYSYIFLIFISVVFFSCKEKPKIYTIGFSQCSNDEWRRKMNTEMQHEAMLHPDIHLEIKTVIDNTEKQIADIQYFIDKNADLIIVSPNTAAPITPVIEKAYNAGIPVILVDRKILSDKYTAFIGADNDQIGKDAGNYIAKLLNGKGNVFEIRGLEGSSPAIDRRQGFLSIISNYPEINLLSSVDGAWLKDVAESKMEEALAKFPVIDIVYAHNDRMAMGAYNAALRHNRADEIWFVGIDAIPGADGGIEQVLENRLTATFIYPTSGDKIIQLALDILHGKPFDKNNTLYTNVVDETNARVLKLQTDVIIEQEDKINFLNQRVDSYLSQYTTQRYLLFSAGFIVFLFIVFFVFLYKAYHSKNRLNLELEKRNNEINEQKDLLEQQRDQLIELSKKLEEATHAKLVFFTNISHEFRTPLTLISGPVSSLLADKNISEEQHRLLALAQKNVNVLLKLIDQIIDFRKYENGKLKLNLSSNNLYEQLMEWNESFRELSKRKQLHFDFHFNQTDFRMIYDSEKMERIYFNLLSNAFKFTSEKGYVSVNMEKTSNDKGDTAIIRISNSGKGISKHDIQNIFDRFYQVDSHIAGSGIGLALVKALIELHQGEIQVESDDITGMTTFMISIPFSQDAPCESENQMVVLKQKEPVDYHKADNCLLDDAIDKSKELILVIDDNPDIRSYIKTVLENRYTIIEAKDGADGFRKAVKYIPDIVVSDVMMPPPDGVELCRQLKKEISTAHIPVILLTACSLDEQRIVGFESGTDDYISKPFNPDVLEVRIRNLIENRRQLKESFQKDLFSSDSKTVLNDLNEDFIKKLRELMEANLSDTNLSVEDLGQNMGFSRTQLYRKVKSLTGYSPNELLKIIRLKKAFVLLSSSDLNISEIAYDTGFTSPSYFAKCFKEYYDESPTDYLKRIRK